MRYTLEIEVTGNAEGKLRGVANGLGKVNQQASQLGGSLKGTGEQLDDISGKMGAGLFGAFSDKLKGAAGEFEEMVDGIVGKSREFVSSIIKDAATFQDAQSDMKFAFGKDWESVYKQVLDDSARLTFTFEETSRLASSLGKLKINPFGGTSAESQLFKSRTGESVRALDVLQDTADAAGKSTDDLIAAIRNAVGGQWKSLKDRFDIPVEMMARIKKAAGDGKDLQKVYNAIVSESALVFGGAGALKAENWNKIMAQVPDLMQQIRAAAGAEGLKVLAKAMKGFVDALTGVAKNKDVMKALSDGFMSIASVLVVGINLGSSMVRWVGKIVEAAPWLPKVAAWLGIITLAGLALATVLSGILVTVVGIVAAIMAVGWEVILGVAAGLVLLAPLLIPIVGLMVGLGVALKATADVASGDWDGDKGVFGIFAKGKLIWEGLSQVFESFDGKTSKISTETAGKLKKAGLWEFFQDLQAFVYKASVAWDAFNLGLEDIAQIVGPVIIPLIEEIGDMINELSGNVGDSSGKVTDWKDAGLKMAHALAEIGKWTVIVIRVMVGFARIVIYVSDLGHAFDRIKTIVHTVTSAVEKLVGVLKSIGSLTGLDLIFGGGKGAGGEPKNRGFLEGLFHEKATITKSANYDMTNSKVKDFGLGDEFNKMSVKERMADLRKKEGEGVIDPAVLARVSRGQSANPEERPERGMNLDSWLASPVSLTPKAGANSSVDRLRTNESNAPAQNSTMDPRMMYAATERQTAAIEKLSSAIMSRPTEVKLDGKVLASSMNQINQSSSGNP